MFISIHIPKTAGTTLSIIFDYGCGRRIFYDYNYLQEFLKASKENAGFLAHVDEIKCHKDFIQNNFSFIHGHFFYRKYQPIFPDARYITCVRDPLKRLVSYYHHVLDGTDPALGLLDEVVEGLPFYDDFRAGKMDIVDIASLPAIGNLQSTYLHGRDIKDYDHVFINEKLAESVYQFQLSFGFQRNDPFMNLKGEKSIPQFNEKGSRRLKRAKIPKATLEKARSLLEEDNELYARALEKFDMQAKAAARH